MKLKVLLFFLSLFYCIDYIAANFEKTNNSDEGANLNGELVSGRSRLRFRSFVSFRFCIRLSTFFVQCIINM